ncbi:MAG: hypothetical protein E3K32_06885 [wastewater metagenome]|nr:hypothetical protein [Candidatus Loosdrechtia aerotolerans]
MKRIGYFFGVVCITSALVTSYAVKTTFAGESCCGSKKASAAEESKNACVVCGKTVGKGKGIKVECEGKTVVLCCKSCETAFKEGCESEKKCCEKHEEGHHHH